MSLLYRRWTQISRLSPHIFSGKQLQQSRGGFINLSLSSSIPLPHSFDSNPSTLRTRRFSTTSKVSNECFALQLHDLLPFIQSSLDKLQGFMGNGLHCIFFKDFKNPVIYHEKDLDLGNFNKAIEELNVQENVKFDEGNSGPNLKTTWAKQAEVIKEPHLCSSLQNLLLCFPGCVSADESGNRLFLSDSNHHRIIVFDGSGKILDSIGSCPGFEDGEFESAKLARPAASFYDNAEDCLYIVDSENHAIRRADLERRVLETLYPTCSFSKKNNSVWTWIMDKLGFRNTVDVRSVEFDSRPLVFPWHLLKSVDGSFLIISHSFENLWVMDLVSGEIKECIKGFPNILKTFGQLIMEKLSFLKEIPIDYLKQQSDVNCPLKEFQHATLISALTTFENHIVMCDTVAHRVLKISRESGACSNFQFSNFGTLGLPYWLSFPVERVYSV
ncbi:unnamed protein product [Dovyalis caffra]|uniref:NHL repeat-containing protein 2 n=1 Tax=Dovyalis caffra TaxID=77055 RepID=A0AAV1SHL7_9ROSI|nr:unnamed protein product [Dovyalis caffra]